MKSIPVKLFLILILNVSPLSGWADDSVRFGNPELKAVSTLLRPELNSIELHGRKVIYHPAPSIRYLGVDSIEIPLDLNFIADLVDLEFNHLKGKMPELRFANSAMEIRVPVEDQERAIQSRLGSISFKGVALTAQLKWKTLSNGQQELVLHQAVFEGSVKGSGMLRNGFILKKTREFLMMLLSRAMKGFLGIEKVQQMLASGLVEYGKFYTGNEARELVPGSIELHSDGVQYQVQR